MKRQKHRPVVGLQKPHPVRGWGSSCIAGLVNLARGFIKVDYFCFLSWRFSIEPAPKTPNDNMPSAGEGSGTGVENVTSSSA